MVKKRLYKPKNDNEFLEHVAKIIFVAGFRYSIVEERWPLIRKAFYNFNIKKLSNLNKKQIKKIMMSKGMIKNIGKIEAIIDNAKICKKIEEEQGSVLNWIEKTKKDYKKDPLFSPSLEDIFTRFNRIGKTTSGWLASLHNARGKSFEYEM